MTPDARTLLEQAVMEAIGSGRTVRTLDYADQGWIGFLGDTSSGKALLALADRASAAEAERDQTQAYAEGLVDDITNLLSQRDMLVAALENIADHPGDAGPLAGAALAHLDAESR